MIRIEVSPSTANALQAQAVAQGLTVAAYLERVLVWASNPPAPPLSREELDRLLDEEASRGHSPSGSFSRADIHGDHD